MEWYVHISHVEIFYTFTTQVADWVWLQQQQQQQNHCRVETARKNISQKDFFPQTQEVEKGKIIMDFAFQL